MAIKEEPREGEGLREISTLKKPFEPEIFGIPEGETMEEHIAKVRMVSQVQRSALVLPMYVHQSNGRVITLQALIDTGCVLNLIRRGLVAPEFFRAATTKYRLVTASGSPLAGGEKEIALGWVAKGKSEGGCGSFTFRVSHHTFGS